LKLRLTFIWDAPTRPDATSRLPHKSVSFSDTEPESFVPAFPVRNWPALLLCYTVDSFVAQGSLPCP
jgi:hypothetical protein